MLFNLLPNEQPTVVVTYNDIVDIRALQATHAHQLSVPQDISVIGCDNIAMAAHTNPPLTTIDQPKRRLGKPAMRRMHQMIQSKGYAQANSPLVVRQSTRPRKPNEDVLEKIAQRLFGESGVHLSIYVIPSSFLVSAIQVRR